MKTILFALITASQLTLVSSALSVDPVPTPEATPALVQTTCESDVYYTWKPTPPPAPKEPGQQQRPEPAPEPREHFFWKVKETGMGNAEGEAKLKPRLVEAESRAKKACEERHQSQSGCVTQSLRTLGAEFSQLDFETRRVVRQKIVDDCAHDYGVCVSTRATAITCMPDPSAPSPAAAPEAEKKKK